MKMYPMFAVLTIAALAPAVAGAQQKKIVCADNTVVTTAEACASRGGVQKPGGLNRVGKEINKAAIDTKHEAERTPKNVAKGAKTMGHNVHEAAGDVSKGTQKTLKKAKHGAGEAAGDVSKGAQKAVRPKTYTATCKDGTTWTGRAKGNACKGHGGVAG
jgi:hypothetical protein